MFFVVENNVHENLKQQHKYCLPYLSRFYQPCLEENAIRGEGAIALIVEGLKRTLKVSP